MAFVDPVIQNLCGPGFMAPAAGTSSRSKPMGISSAEDALNILNLVNIDGEVFDPLSLQKDAPSLIKIASGIVKARKAGAGINFENGRIMLSRELFDSIVRAAESYTSDQYGGGRQKINWV